MILPLLFAASFSVGPFYQQAPEDGDLRAVRPFWAEQDAKCDVLWPIFTKHDDWWRALLFIHYQEHSTPAASPSVPGARPPTSSYQFEVMPIWFNGKTTEEKKYWGLFPLYGEHPHIATLWDLQFALWPVWMQYRTPRPSHGDWLTSNNVLFPFVHWRSDGAWGLWPLYELNYRRESVHRAALWPIVTWAGYREDRDTAGEGTSWMVFPLYGRVRRARESQDLVLPPLFSYAETPQTWRLRCPWPIVEVERGIRLDRTVVFPLYEDRVDKRYRDGVEEGGVTRFGWRFVELYWDKHNELEETRVFPIWTKSSRYFRVWPFYESSATDFKCQEWYTRVFPLIPIRWIDSIDRNWSPFWTFYEALENPVATEHALFWGLIRWRTVK